jgi:hypothetical protein
MTTASPDLEPPWSSERNSFNDRTFPLDFFPFLAEIQQLKIHIIIQGTIFNNLYTTNQKRTSATCEFNRKDF